MSLDERSPKRQRLSSYSPAQSPEPKASSSELPHQGHSFPQTPPPSVHMSPSWAIQNLPTSACLGSFPTPPSTAGLQGPHVMAERTGGSEGDALSVIQTPAAEDEGEFKRDGDGDAEMQEGTEGGNVEHRRTDHERHTILSPSLPVSAVPKLYKLLSERKFLHAVYGLWCRC